MADQNVDGLVVAIKADLSDYINKLDQMQTKTQTTAEKTAASFTKVGTALTVVGAAFGAFAATAIKSAMSWGNAVDDLSDKTGLAGEKSSELLLIAKRVGIGADEAGGMFAKFARSASTAAQAQADAAVQGKKSTDAYTKLGITLLNENGTLKDTETLFKEVKTAIMGMPDGLQKTATEMELFGRSGAAMHDMLNMTEAEMQAVIEKGRALGLVLSTEQAAAWEKFERDVNGAKGTLTALGITIGNEMMPQLREMLDGVTSATKAFQNMSGPAKDLASGVMKFAAEVAVATIAVRILGTALGVSLGPWGLVAAAIVLATGKLSDWNKESQLAQQTKAGGVWKIVGNHSVFVPFSQAEKHDPEHDSQGAGAGAAKLPATAAKQTETPYVGSASGGGGTTKTELEEYLANLTEYKDIWTRQIELGQISQTQFRDLLTQQLAGLEQISVGQDEQLSKERGIYDLKSLLRQAEMSLIAERRAATELEFARNTISENEYYAKKMQHLKDEISLTAEGSEKNLALKKQLITLEDEQYNKQKARTLANISQVQQLRAAEIAIEQEQLQHQQRMQAIGAIGVTENQLEQNAAAEKRILDASYQNNLNTVKAKIAAQKTASDADREELKKLLVEKTLLESKYNADSLRAADRLQEEKAELQRQTASDYAQMMTDMVMGTKSGQDIMQMLWTDFVNKVIQKLLMMAQVENLVNSVIGGIFGGGGGGSKLSLPNTTLPGRASGGPVASNTPYLVGEQGPELFVPTSSGTVVSNGALASAGASPIAVTLINNTGTEATPTISQGFDMGKQVISIVLDAANRNVGGMRDMMRGMARG